MADEISVFPPGARIRIFGGVEARVIFSCIQPGPSVEYKVAYWSGTSLHQEWLAEHLIESGDERKAIALRPGF